MQDLSNKRYHSQEIRTPTEQRKMSLPFEVGRVFGMPQQGSVVTRQAHQSQPLRVHSSVCELGKRLPLTLPLLSNKAKTGNKA